MKNKSSKIVLFTSLLALAGMFAAPAVRAQGDDAAKAEKKAKREAEMLKKYDTNHDGKLDDAEKAAMKADQDKAKAERKAKKEKSN